MRRKNWKNYSVDELENLLPVSERWENQNLSNDFMFGKVMSDKKACAGVLKIILPEIEIGEITFTEIQKPLRDSIDSRGVRFDVYTKSENGKRYDIEIQTTDNRDLFRRTRAYHAVLGSDILMKKETRRYSDMPDEFVIFICTFDPFRLGRHVYTFRNFCCEDKNLELGDGTSTIFLNAYGKDASVNADIKNLLNFVIGITCEDPFIKYLEGLLNTARQNAEWRRNFVLDKFNRQTLIDSGYYDGYDKGFDKGKLEEKFSTAQRLIEMGLSLADVVRATQLSPDDIAKLT